MTDITLQNMADALGNLKAQMAELQEQEAALKRHLSSCLPSGTSVEGRYYRVTVSATERTSVNWKAVAAKLCPSRQLITAHTSTSDVTTVRVSARKTS